MPPSPSTEPFDLLESLLFDPRDGYRLLDEHLARLERSARHFGYPYPRDALAGALERAVEGVTAPRKVRLLLGRDGAIKTATEALTVSPNPVRVVLARAPIDPADPLLYHKTTRRGVYEQALAGRDSADDVLLWNPAGEVTEASSSNVVVRLDGVLVTPPVAAGLLAGTLRAVLLRDGAVRERVVRVDDLARADALYLVNSVRGWRTAAYENRPK